ncbi:uncharacterized protein LOC143296954 isoform X2 [Babylonia areolata]|uniref:uncharacterized protein LOC143296954 isoform X2 n=1 Tax=Babylonia areolata TaxID=304850 RepID=UPI003FD2BD56
MNTGDPSIDEENSQSCCSDSSSIPSTLSDCEGVPLLDLPFSVQNSSFSHDLRWFTANDKSEPGLASVEDGNSLPLSLGAPLNPSHLPGVEAEPSLRESVKLASLERDLLHLSEVDLLASSSASQQLELGSVILESEQPGSSSMSRTLPIKPRDRAQLVASTDLPPTSAEAGPSSQDGVQLKDAGDRPSVGIISKSDDRSTDGVGKTVCDMAVSVNTVQFAAAAASETCTGSGEDEMALNTVAAGCSAMEDTDLQQEGKLSHSQQTAFPIPPLPEQAESLMRHIDTLSMPTVSPDSGIFASSPSGNDSPGSVTSVTAGESAVESQPSSSHALPHSQQSETKEQRQQEFVALTPQSPPPTVVCSEEKKATGETEEVHEQGLSTFDEGVFRSVSQQSDDYFVERVVSEIPSPFRGPSSGRKKRGRPPKRNKSQMLQHKKSTLYSGLYTSDSASSSAATFVDSTSVQESVTVSVPVDSVHESAAVSVPVDCSMPEYSAASGSTSNNVAESASTSTHTGKVQEAAAVPVTGDTSNSETAKDTENDYPDTAREASDNGSDMVVCQETQDDNGNKTDISSTQSTEKIKEPVDRKEHDACDRKLTEKRGRGRPKGSKNKRFFTVVKSRAWKARGAKNMAPLPFEAVRSKPVPKPGSKTVERKDSSTTQKEKVKIQSDTESAKVKTQSKTHPDKINMPARSESKNVKTSSKAKSLNVQVMARKEPFNKGKRGRGRPRKQPISDISNNSELSEDSYGSLKSNSNCISLNKNSMTTGRQSTQEKSRAEADSELASLIQSVQHSIQSQFASRDIDETSEFAMDTNNDISEIEPSLPQVSVKSSAAKTIKSPVKEGKKSPPKKPKIHVMMRRTKRRKKKRLQKDCPKPVPPVPANPPETEEETQTSSSFRDLTEQECSTVSTGSLFGPTSTKPVVYFNRYRQSKILKQSSFKLHSSALGNALNRNGDESSDDDRDGSEGRKRKKKKKLLYFKTKHKNIVDPAFMAELVSLESSMDRMTISEQAFIRVKPGEVPLPSIFRLTIIDVKKKKKDKQVLEPPPAPEKSKKIKVRKDSKEREPSMPELVKEKAKNTRKKSLQEDNHPPSLEIQVPRDQCLPPKKRHKMMYEAESTEEAAISPKETTAVPEKRKVGRPRKNPLPDSSGASDKAACLDGKNDGSKPVQDRTMSPITSPTRLSLKKSRHLSGGISTEKTESSVPVTSAQCSSQSPVLACPRHAHQRSTPDMSCAECALLVQSQPQSDPSKSHTRQQQTAQDDSSHAVRACKSKLSLLRKQKVTMNQSKNKGNSNNIECPGETPLISPSTSPRSRTKMIAAALPSAEVVIDPLPESAMSAVASSQVTRKSLNMQCNTSNFSDSGAEDESVIRNVCSEFEPLPLEYCLKRKRSELDTPNRSKRRLRESSSSCEDSGHKSHTTGVRRSSDDSQPPRKRYQRVGLYSDFYKDDEPKKRNEALMRNQVKMSYRKGDSATSLLPPPIHFGKHFRESVIPFQLPYDIWWLYTHDQLHKKEALRPKFKKIRSNVYVDVKPNTRKFEPHPCNCKQPTSPEEKGCLEDCLNRVVFTECTPETCPCGDQCSNQRIQRQEWANNLEKFLTPDRGYGVRTLTAVPVDQIILEYLGEVVSEQEFRRRMTEEYAQDSHHYCLNMDGRTVIDGYRMGNLTRFVNHSCEPNTEMQKWNVNGLYHMVLRTLREIKPYEEITYDYNFHSFNMEAQQECRCGSTECRGVIGGKFQRNGQKQSQPVEGGINRPVSPSTKPMSQRERQYARKHAIFLVRNIDRARGDRNHIVDSLQEKTEEQTTLEKVPNLLSMKDSMNDNRSVRTRLVSLAEENPDLQRRHRLAVIFNNIYNSVASFRDEEGNIIASPLMVLPSRKKYPDYYQTIAEPIDLTTIRNNIKRGFYNDIHSFDADFSRLFKNVETYCGRKLNMDRVISRLRRVYQAACSEAIPQVEEVTGEGVTALSSATHTEPDTMEEVETKAQPVAEDEDEDIIRCICGVYRDEGLMIQCEQCFIWQHCDCVKVKASDAEREDVRYRCELCDPRPVEKEIMDPQKVDQLGPNGEKVEQYLTLMRDDLQIAQGDCVYLMRDFKKPARSSLRLVAFTSPDKMDIFRVEDLFKNSKGERFAAGFMYLRPHETYHEPNRKFFHNELFRYPQYETYPLEQIAGKCVVMDLNTYCKGKPKGFDDRDIYICEFRLDKNARIFTKITKKFPINTKSFCFDKYPKRLCPKRTYVPHAVPQEYLRRGSADKSTDSRNCSKSSSASSVPGGVCKSESRTEVKADSRAEGRAESRAEEKAEGRASSRKLEERVSKKMKLDKEGVLRFNLEEDKKNAKIQRLEKYLQKLSPDIATKQKVDLSYLLEESLGKRPRKKTSSFL